MPRPIQSPNPTPAFAPHPVFVKCGPSSPRAIRRPGKVREQVSEQALGGGRAGRHDVHGGLGDGDCDPNVPCAVGVGGREAVEVDYEAAD